MNPESSISVRVASSVCKNGRFHFVIHTTITMMDNSKSVFEVRRLHDDFIWLYDYLSANELYAGYIIPPAPLNPDEAKLFDNLALLCTSASNFPQQESRRMRSELEEDCTFTFKRCAYSHHLFLQRLASHPVMKCDHNFRVFLEFDGDLSVRTKTRKEKVTELFKTVSKHADETIRLVHQKDDDPFFSEEKHAIAAYNQLLKAACSAAENANRQRKRLSENLLSVHNCLDNLIPRERLDTSEADLISVLSTFFQSYKAIELRLARDEDLNFCDMLRYYDSDSSAAKDLLYRRSRALADHEAANRALHKARTRDKDVKAAEDAQFAANSRFKSISETARIELEEFKVRKIEYFNTNLTELAESQVKRAKEVINLVKLTMDRLNEIQPPAPVLSGATSSKQPESAHPQDTLLSGAPTKPDVPTNFYPSPL